jgi:hypothetical protein
MHMNCHRPVCDAPHPVGQGKQHISANNVHREQRTVEASASPLLQPPLNEE